MEEHCLSSNFFRKFMWQKKLLCLRSKLHTAFLLCGQACTGVLHSAYISTQKLVLLSPLTTYKHKTSIGLKLHQVTNKINLCISTDLCPPKKNKTACFDHTMVVNM